jgi:hypothetical protein
LLTASSILVAYTLYRQGSSPAPIDPASHVDADQILDFESIGPPTFLSGIVCAHEVAAGRVKSIAASLSAPPSATPIAVPSDDESDSVQIEHVSLTEQQIAKIIKSESVQSRVKEIIQQQNVRNFFESLCVLNDLCCFSLLVAGNNAAL